ncbi:hypothetical protein, partial [Pseudoxanthomonas mexicana]
VQQVWPDSLSWRLLRPEPRCSIRAAESPHSQPSRSRLRVIVLVPKLRLSEAKVPHEWPPMPLTRVRSENAAIERDAATRSEPGYNTAANQRPNTLS